MATRGKLILLEGISGSGKTTLAHELVEHLKAQGIRVRFESEPTKGVIGKGIRKLIEGKKFTELQVFNFSRYIVQVMLHMLLHEDALSKPLKRRAYRFKEALEEILNKMRAGEKLSELEYQLLYIADRLLHLTRVIIPALTRGEWVVLDRYDLSTYAYGVAHGLKMKDLYEWHKAALTEHYLAPDVTFYIDVPASVAVERLKRSGKAIDRFETLASLKRVGMAYEHAILMRRKEGDRAFTECVDGVRAKHAVLKELKRLIGRYRMFWK